MLSVVTVLGTWNVDLNLASRFLTVWCFATNAGLSFWLLLQMPSKVMV